MTDNTQAEALAALIERFRGLHIDHKPDGWPAVRTREITALLDRIAELEAQLEAIGACGVSGPLIGQPQAMPDLSQLTERGAKAWAGVGAQGLREGFTAADMATVSAQGFRDGVASVSAGSEPVAWQYRSVRDKSLWFDCTEERAQQQAAHPAKWDVRYLYTHPYPKEGMAGWKLVPIEPTPAMLAAVVTSMDDFLLGKEAEKQYREDWAAMLDAAPAPSRI